MAKRIHDRSERKTLNSIADLPVEPANALLDRFEAELSREECAAIEAEWLAVAEERMRELDVDPSLAIPLEQVMADSRKRLR